MKVIFLDFDGVLNSEGSFNYEEDRRNRNEIGVKGKVMETLCNVNTSNFQRLMNKYPGTKIVISSTWREFFNLDWLREKLASYHIKSAAVIDKTPQSPSGNRGLEIKMWLDAHPEVDHYIIIDDNDWGITEYHPADKFVKTDWDTGFTAAHLREAEMKLKSPKKRKEKQ